MHALYMPGRSMFCPRCKWMANISIYRKHAMVLINIQRLIWESRQWSGLNCVTAFFVSLYLMPSLSNTPRSVRVEIKDGWSTEVYGWSLVGNSDMIFVKTFTPADFPKFEYLPEESVQLKKFQTRHIECSTFLFKVLKCYNNTG